jgi:hypothetical protein
MPHGYANQICYFIWRPKQTLTLIIHQTKRHSRQNIQKTIKPKYKNLHYYYSYDFINTLYIGIWKVCMYIQICNFSLCNLHNKKVHFSILLLLLLVINFIPKLKWVIYQPNFIMEKRPLHSEMPYQGSNYKGQYKSNASFFLRNCNCNKNEIYTDDSYIFCNCEVIFLSCLYHFQHTFATVQ